MLKQPRRSIPYPQWGNYMVLYLQENSLPSETFRSPLFVSAATQKNQSSICSSNSLMRKKCGNWLDYHLPSIRRPSQLVNQLGKEQDRSIPYPRQDLKRDHQPPGSYGASGYLEINGSYKIETSHRRRRSRKPSLTLVNGNWPNNHHLLPPEASDQIGTKP